MVTEFKFPDVGEGVTEGTLIKWLVSEGDEVEEDESLAEVETDKAVVEIPSPEHATVLKLHAEEGELIKVGNVIVTLSEEDEEPAADSGTSGEESTDGDAEQEEPTPSEEPSVADMTVDEVKEQVETGDISASAALAAEKDGKERTTLISWLEGRTEEQEDDDEDAEASSEAATDETEPAEEDSGESDSSTSVVGVLEDADHPKTGGKVKAAPSVRKLARENGVDINTVKGSGPGGRVTRSDVVAASEDASGTQQAQHTQETQQVQKAAGGRVLATPATRRLAKEQDVDISTVNGTGPGGRVTDEDVKAAASGEPSQAPQEKTPQEPGEVGPSGGLGTPNRFAPREYDFEQYGEVEREEMSTVRKAIAKNMERSKYTAPHVTATDDADVTELWDVRSKEKEVAESRGIHLTFIPFIVKACISAMRDYPLMNASFDETTGEIVKKNYFNIGVAVATERGLLVPNVKNAERKSILRIAKEVNELAQKARRKEITLDEMQGGTFTITNYGSIGGRYGTPIINCPEVAILGTGTISDEAVVRNGEVVVRKMLPLSVTFDHRVVDGAYVAQFMNELIKHLEDPDLLLLD